MSKIRINELARELEVKPSVIIDMLPELGVTEKKTHSSSVDDDVALGLRARLTGEARPAGITSHEGHDHEAEEDSHAEEAVEPAPAPPKAGPAEVPRARPTPVVHATPAPKVAKAPAPPEPTPVIDAVASEPEPPPAPRSLPIRPPLASGGPVSRPISSGPRTPIAPLATPVRPTLPARPTPPATATRPGQILSGPRQPIPTAPAGSQTPAAPSTPQTPKVTVRQPIAAPPAVFVGGGQTGSAVPGAPRPPAPRTPSPQQRPIAPAAAAPRPPAATIAPGAPSAPRAPQAGRPLVGQPSARPIVPPRPDMVDRLAQLRQSPAAPSAPRPGVPSARSASPVPGRPIYQGTVRPGQPMPQRPGAPPGQGAGGYQNRPSRGRPMHPTTPGRIEPASAIPVDPGRRNASQKRPTGGHQRTRDVEGKLKSYGRKNEEPAPPPPIDREITISEGVTVKELSEKLAVKTTLVIKKLLEKKVFATINQTLETKLAEEIAREFGASTNKVSYEEEKTWEVELAEETKDLVHRAPVVTIMGHVDHGKTSLLDSIRSARVAEREAGGITQHIGAYQVEQNGKKIVFIDTPGHEAFTRMRARGAKVTDVVILVVAADDGVMPQTLEAIDHAKAAGVPIIVAINKVDKPDAQPERIKQQLADRGLLAEDWGGDIVMVPVSAKAKTNLDLLLEMVLLVADIGAYKANPGRPAVGNVLEAKLDRGRGPVATVLVRNGTLRVGDFFLCGAVMGKVRAMFDDRGNQIREAGPATPVEVLGLDSLPEVGDSFQVTTDTAKAKQIVMYREAKNRDVVLAKNKRMTLEQLHAEMQIGGVKDLNIIIKSDVGGTAEVLSDTLQQLSTEKVRLRVIHSGVGAITETDVLLASASNAIIIGFNVRPERNAQQVADREKVDIRLHSIIYEVTDEMKKAMTGLLDPVFKEIFKGRAEVRNVFRITKVGTVAGCYVTEGVITRASEVRVLRDKEIIHTGKINALKRFKDDASEVKFGYECGISLSGFSNIKEGDIFEAFVMERVEQEALV